MDKYNQLLLKAANEYRIIQGISESNENYKVRIIYTIIGKMALAALFDSSDSESISIIHVKKRIIELLRCYKSMYPEVNQELAMDASSLANEIYELYLNNGYIYHEPNRAILAQKSKGAVGQLTFTRGYLLETKQNVSGLGDYLYDTDCESSVTEMYCMDKSPLSTKWKTLISDIKWIHFEKVSFVEYLRMDPPFSKGYWIDKPYDDGRVSLLRTGEEGNRLYYYYRVVDDEVNVCPIPNWMVEGAEYRNLANACLASNDSLPPTQYYYDGDIVHLKFQYLFPPTEFNLYKIYSWPEHQVKLPCDFKRIMNRDVFESLKSLMITVGYNFTEEKYE